MNTSIDRRAVAGLCCALLLALSGCSRQQSDWQKTRETNTAEGYEQFLKKYPSGEFTAQAQARVKELYEERDWQKARDADTPEAYQAFLKQYPEGKWTEEARIRVENFTLAQPPSGGAPPAAASAASPGTAPPAGSPASGADAGEQSAPPAAPPAAGTRAPKKAAAADGVSKPKPGAGAPGAGAPAAGAYGVQLGAFKSGTEAAHQRWERLTREFPSLLGGLTSKVLSGKTSAGSIYRLQASGVSEKRARQICSALKAKSQPCLVVPPKHG